MPTDLGRVPIVPGALDQRTSGMAIPGFRNRPLTAPRPTRGFRGSQTQIIHELSELVEACQGAEFGHRGDGHCALHAAQGLQGLNNGM